MFRNLRVFSRNYAKAVINKTKAKDLKQVKKEAKLAPAEDVIDSNINGRFLERTIGGAYKKWVEVLEKHPEIKSLRRKDVVIATETLKTLNFTHNDILSKPMVLFNSPLTIENRYKILQECGFHDINMMLLFKYITIINKTVALLKKYNYIRPELNAAQNLTKSFNNIELELPSSLISNDNVELKKLREQILSIYLKQCLGMTKSDLEKLWHVYGRVRHKSFQSVQNMINILEELNFSHDRIIKNGFVLYGDAENVRRIINEVKTIDGQDVREIVYKRPKILMSSCDSLLKTLEHVRNFGIHESAILRCLEVLTLGPDTILERLRDLNNIEEFKVLDSNPRILRLVHYQNKARLRLDYLNQLKVRCASLHILSCGSDTFAK